MCIRDRGNTGSLEYFNVDGMTCSHCEESIIKSLLKLDGITNVTADAKLGIVGVDGSESMKNDVIKIITDLGYEVKDK